VIVAVLPSEYCSTTVVLPPADELIAISGAAWAEDAASTMPASSADTVGVIAVGVQNFVVIIDSSKITVNVAVAENKKQQKIM
ncbi:hypothetical protein, partial [Pseudomonas sp. HY7a-MNA-CIBAN-0227]|uniref:hypothetical protein n=1 Tax=Pseudomonas sp. HY7a-MNA-CIBAN-0227 TaxID=3140474 RepID=UPI00331F2FBB